MNTQPPPFNDYTVQPDRPTFADNAWDGFNRLQTLLLSEAVMATPGTKGKTTIIDERIETGVRHTDHNFYIRGRKVLTRRIDSVTQHITLISF